MESSFSRIVNLLNNTRQSLAVNEVIQTEGSGSSAAEKEKWTDEHGAQENKS